jgi:AcrR family transcriptional regulator
MAKQAYHHGDLRRALLVAAAEVIAEQGAAGLSLRDLARRAGVSHAAPAHHFGDKAGLLTALATEGYDLLAAELGDEWAATHNFLEQGVAYVRFAVRHRSHFAVMFRPDLYHAGDPNLAAARNRASAALYRGLPHLPGDAAARPQDSPGAHQPVELREAGLAAWSIAHGFATLRLSGAFPDLAGDPDRTARAVLGHLSPPRVG